MSVQQIQPDDDINQIEVFEQPEKTSDNILDYFNIYVKGFYAFKDEPAFKAILSFFVKYYVDIIYNKQPIKFKELFEEQIINQDIIDLLLVSIGLPENLIREITTTTKFIILRSFADFERYKGTIKFFQQIGGALPDHMSYYELFIDYDETYVNPPAQYLVILDRSNISNNSYFYLSSVHHDYAVVFKEKEQNSIQTQNIDNRIIIEIEYDYDSTSSNIAKKIIAALNETKEFFLNVNSTDILEIQLADHGVPKNPPSKGTTELTIKTAVEGKSKGSWVLRPRPVYVHPKMKLVTENFSYQEAYNKIPTLLVPEEQLQNLRDRDEIIIPTKSNIILLDYTATIDGSMLNTLFFTILMEYIGDDYFSVLFTGSEGTSTITYNTAFFLWYYLMARYYGSPLEGIDLAYRIVMGTKRVTNFVLDDIERIENEYNNISTWQEMQAFYTAYYDEPFGRPYSVEKTTLNKMSETLRHLDPTLWQYVENRLESAEDLSQDIQFLLDEIYASIVLSFDRYKNNKIIYKYIPLLLQFLTQITTHIRNTDSYKITYNLKPFHTEILDLARSKIEIDDKFNALLLYDDYPIIYQLILAGLLQLSDQVMFSFNPDTKGSSSLSLVSLPICNFKYPVKISNSSLKVIYEIITRLEQVSQQRLQITTFPKITNWFYDSFNINSFFDINSFKWSTECDYNIFSKFEVYHNPLMIDFINTSDQLMFRFSPIDGESLPINSIVAINSCQLLNEFIELKENLSLYFTYTPISILRLESFWDSTFLKLETSQLGYYDDYLNKFLIIHRINSNLQDQFKLFWKLEEINQILISDQNKFGFSPDSKTSLNFNSIMFNEVLEIFKLNCCTDVKLDCKNSFMLSISNILQSITKIMYTISPYSKLSCLDAIELYRLFKFIDLDCQVKEILNLNLTQTSLSKNIIKVIKDLIYDGQYQSELSLNDAVDIYLNGELV